VARAASAKRHAQALFQIALESNEVEKWRSELDEIAATLSDPQLLAILENPKVHFDDKLRLVRKCLPEATHLALNFVSLLVSRQRLGILSQIVDAYGLMADAHEGLEHASVITAITLDEPDKEALAGHLATMTGKRIVLSDAVDPDIIGGFVARVGDRLIDGSLRARLEALKKTLAQAAR
jgi:F-type H+-transporting ATPase subunit delta